LFLFASVNTHNRAKTMNQFSAQEIIDIRELFGAAPDELDAETFKAKLRALRATYHPDNFEKFGDAVVRQLATDRFQQIERLADKLEKYRFGDGSPVNVPDNAPDRPTGNDLAYMYPAARFAYRAMKIEIRTGDKDLKYHLFSTFYRWLIQGERFKIPDAKNAYLIADEAHAGRKIGYTESIRVYLTFEEDDPVEQIAAWLFNKIEGRADMLLIEGEIVPMEANAILWAIKKRSFKMLAATGE